MWSHPTLFLHATNAGLVLNCNVVLYLCYVVGLVSKQVFTVVIANQYSQPFSLILASRLSFAMKLRASACRTCALKWNGVGMRVKPRLTDFVGSTGPPSAARRTSNAQRILGDTDLLLAPGTDGHHNGKQIRTERWKYKSTGAQYAYLGTHVARIQTAS